MGGLAESMHVQQANASFPHSEELSDKLLSTVHFDLRAQPFLTEPLLLFAAHIGAPLKLQEIVGITR